MVNWQMTPCLMWYNKATDWNDETDTKSHN